MFCRLKGAKSRPFVESSGRHLDSRRLLHIILTSKYALMLNTEVNASPERYDKSSKASLPLLLIDFIIFATPNLHVRVLKCLLM